MASRRDLLDMLAVLVETLHAAPHKHRLDFQPYWDWFDGPRANAIGQAEALLKEPVEK